ncbi:MAG: hypothetical protein FJ109_09590 [Deltaproteobacteria bacterium]|nr:hypothetical protein [Deltaproteobacteria bacterium]
MCKSADFLKATTVLTVMVALSTLAAEAGAVTSRVRYEAANYALNKGDGYKKSNNESSVLATNESYVLASYVIMYRATGDRVYLDRLVDHVDWVLKARDDAAGVTEYNGASSACWRNLNLQAGKQPYCHVFHSGLITWPMAEFAADVYANNSLWSLTAADGTTYKEKADNYVLKVKETLSYHDATWKDGPGAGEGYYTFAADATFIPEAGKEVPLSASSALGLTLLAMHTATGDAAYAAKAAAIAKRVKGQLTLQANGAYVWNYAGGQYKAPGENISSGSVLAGFAYRSFQAGSIFDALDIGRFANTFFRNIYKDSGTLYDAIGGTGSVNTSGYVEQVGRWVMFATVNASVYAIVRDLYDSFDPTKTGHGSQVLGYAYLTLFEPIAVPHKFYPQDWADNVTYKTATAQSSNLLLMPPDTTLNAITPVTYRSTVPVAVQQFSNKYTDILFWTATGGQWKTRWMPFHPELWAPYGKDGEALFQFTENPFVGIEVTYAKSIQLAAVTTQALPAALIGQPWTAKLEGIGELPFEWKLLSAPDGMSIDWTSGVLAWTKAQSLPGTVNVKIRLSTDYGSTDVLFALDVAAPDGTPCADSDACTTGDVYTAGVCKGTPLDCTALDASCMTGKCQAGACVALPKEGACDDGDPCTTGDACAAGVCFGTGMDCSALDGTCVVGMCQAGVCIASPIEAVCDDADSCTVNDKCIGGVCEGSPMDCSALDAGCFAGVCFGGACEPAPVDGACDDGDACTEGDWCVDGQCTGAPKDCSQFVAGPCVKPACIQGVCYGKPIIGLCDDSDPCTQGETCKDGLCEGGQPMDCSGIVGTCITGACENGQCVPVPTTEPCDDGDPCTVDDTCSPDGCGGKPKSCPAGTWCILGECVDIPVEEQPDVVEPYYDSWPGDVVQPEVTAPDAAFPEWIEEDLAPRDDTTIPKPDMGGQDAPGTPDGAVSEDFSGEASGQEDGDIIMSQKKKGGGGCATSATPSAGAALLLLLVLALALTRIVRSPSRP